MPEAREPATTTPTPRAPCDWIPEFRRRYEAWWPQAQPLLQAHDYATAFKTYPAPAFEATPWAPVRVPLEQARLGVVTTAGVYRRGLDVPFADTEEGDPRLLTFGPEVDPAALDVAHGHIPPEPARADINVVLPLDPLRALVREGRLGGLAPRLFSLVGYQTRADRVGEQTAPAIAAAMAEDGVTLALVAPV